MAGISSKSAGGLENKKKYNGIEHTTDLDLNQYDAFFRTLDPQIGRFWQIDPQTDLLESYTPYESMGNNPISNVDPLGDFKTRFGAWLHSLCTAAMLGRMLMENGMYQKPVLQALKMEVLQLQPPCRMAQGEINLWSWRKTKSRIWTTRVCG